MYKSTYLSVRIHTAEEALNIMPDTNVDILLWLIDVYDLGENRICAKAVQKLIMKHYHTLHERVPGLLPRWTKGMMAWVTFLNALEPCYEFDKQWVIENNMLISVEPPQVWSIDDVLTTLDAIAMRWKAAHLLNRVKLEQYLHCLWSIAKNFTMHLHPHLQNGLKEGNLMKIHPKQIMAFFSRFYWFNKTLDLYDLYDREEKIVECNAFFKHELRHFILRKFRDELLTDVWETVAFYGDMEIAGHDSLGEGLSTYSCIYKRHPVCILQKMQQQVLYEDPLEVQKAHSTAVNLKIIQTYFMNNYKIDFKKFFFCSEKNHTKHWQAVKESIVPVIVESFGKFSVVSGGKAYCHSKIEDVFPVWVTLSEKPHGLDLTELKNKLFGKSNAATRGSIYELTI